MCRIFFKNTHSTPATEREKRWRLTNDIYNYIYLFSCHFTCHSETRELFFSLSLSAVIHMNTVNECDDLQYELHSSSERF